MNKELRERILDKAIELCLLADGDEMMYGDSYVEFGERSIKVINPQNVEVSHNKNGVTAAIYGESPIKPVLPEVTMKDDVNHAKDGGSE